MISIIIPVYNDEKYIGRCIESLINQTLNDIEIILINDGSSDKSAEICKSYAEDDQRIVFLEEENKGVSVARNEGIKVAKGEWITFVDSDDWAENNMCELALEKATSSNADVVFWNYTTDNEVSSRPSKLIEFPSSHVIENKALLQSKVISQYAGGIVRNNGVSAGAAWGKLCKKSILDRNNIFFVPGLIRGEDTLFWLYVFEFSNKIVLLDEYLYHYFLSNFSICSGNKYIPNCEVPFNKVISEYNKFINKYHPNEPIYIEAVDLRKIQILYWNIQHKYFNKKYRRKFNVIKKEIKKLISSDIYNKSIKRVKVNYLPISLRILVVCMRRNMISIYYVLYKMIKLLKDILHRR